MKHSVETTGDGTCKIALEGALDIEGSATLDPVFRDAAAKQDKLVVDLSGVDFLASIGIRVLVMTAKTIAGNGGRMAVHSAQEAPAKVLASTGVDRIVMLVEDEDAALAWVNR